MTVYGVYITVKTALPWYGFVREYSRFKNSSISWSSSAKHRLTVNIRKAKVQYDLKGIIFRLNGDFGSPKWWFLLAAAIVGQNSAHYIVSFLPIGSLCCMAHSYWSVWLSIRMHDFDWMYCAIGLDSENKTINLLNWKCKAVAHLYVIIIWNFQYFLYLAYINYNSNVCIFGKPVQWFST